MIALIGLHINYLVSEKVFLFMMFLLVLGIGYLLYASNINEAESTLLFYEHYYAKEFTIEMVNFGKLLCMIYLLFMMIVGYVIHQYDVILLNRVSVMTLKLSKIMTVFLLVAFFMTVYVMVFVIISVYLIPYMTIDREIVKLYFDLLFFCFFYALILVYLYEVSRHLLGLILGFFIYFILFIGSINDVHKNQVNTVMKLLYRVGLDLGFYETEGFAFYYSKEYYLLFVLGIGMVIFFLRKNADLIN